jgi:two-component system response regulator HydG
MARVLIVEDDPAVRRALGDRIRHWGHAVDEAGDVEPGIRAGLERSYDLVLLDLQLPGGSGLDVLRALREGEAGGDIVVLTANASIEAAVEAIRAGASDFLIKPADFELVKRVFDRALEGRRVAATRSALAERVAREASDFVAGSPRMTALLEMADRAAASNATLLITGESGTGKQRLAERIHEKSARSGGPFVYVNCVALTDELIESTLFGHEKGAFTGAVAKKEGRLEAAQGGTAFLDEIGDVSPKLQAKLLHFLETGEFERVGGTRALHVDCRIVAATNRDLPRAIAEGRFREDLYYRLNVIGLALPPLRERPDDVARIARSLVAHFARAMKRGPMTLDPGTEALLVRHPWPGNVRQLKNAIERMVVLAEGDVLGPELLAPEIREPGAGAGAAAGGAAAADGDAPLDLRAAVDGFRRAHIARVLAKTGGNKTKAAELLGIQRTHLSLLLRPNAETPPTAESSADDE